MRNNKAPAKPSRLRAALLALVLLGVAALGFAGGMSYAQYRYDDICLDLGGGRDPGGHGICVVVVDDGTVTKP